MSADASLTDALDRFYGARPPQRLGVAVSGGSDSLALLHLLANWGRAELHAVTVNHRLRPEAASEALHVERICAALGVPHAIVEWRGWDGAGNLQDQARRTRYSLIADWARARDLDAVALGHTRDDLAETFLMRLSREAGVDGLSAMRERFERDRAAFHRPLLSCGRAELRADLERRGVRWVEDPSNEDTSYERVRARKALPELARFGVDAGTLARVAGQLREASDALGWAASAWAEERVRETDGDLVIGVTNLFALPAELQRRVLSAALQWVAAAEFPPRREALSEAMEAVRARVNTTLHGCRLLASDMTLRITRELAAVEGLATPTDATWDGRWRLDGPHATDLEIRALGEAVKDCPGWRETGRPRLSLLASPAVWRGETLVAAPLAGLSNGWSASAELRGTFAAFLIRH